MNSDSPNENHRDRGLDFLKGFLVLAMLTYHMVSALKVTVPWHSPILNHIPALLSFVSGSWVFLSGVIVAHYYQPKFVLSPTTTTRRLWIRGAKLLLIFITLNYLVYRLGLKPASKFDLDVLIEVFVRGGGYLSSFEILIGIAYVLIAAPIILALRGLGTALLLALSMIVFVHSILGYSIQPNAWIIMMGFLGILSMQVAGKIETTKFRKYFPKGRVLSIILFILTTALLLISWIFKFGKYDVAFYYLILIAINGFVYVAYSQIKVTGILENSVRRLGRHSLIGYLGQMFIIWSILQLFNNFDLSSSTIIALYFGLSIIVFLIFMHFYDYAHKRLRFVKSIDDFFFR